MESERPAPFDLEKALLLVDLGSDSYPFSEAVNLLAYFRELADAGFSQKLYDAVLDLTAVPRGA